MLRKKIKNRISDYSFGRRGGRIAARSGIQAPAPADSFSGPELRIAAPENPGGSPRFGGLSPDPQAHISRNNTGKDSGK